MKTILIVEDDKRLCEGIAIALADQHTKTITAHNLSSAAKMLTPNISLVVLDIQLPDGNGLDFLKTIKQTLDIPVLLLTANDLETDVVTGFNLGADDYITKPFSLMILRARIGNLLKRFKPSSKSTYVDAHYVFDFNRLLFTAFNSDVALSKTEIKLLSLFVSAKNQTLKRSYLIDEIWLNDGEFVDENALSVTINRLRKKLSTHTVDCPIKTIYGLGYCWVSNV